LLDSTPFKHVLASRISTQFDQFNTGRTDIQTQHWFSLTAK